MIEIDLNKWKLVLFNVQHYPNESIVEGELLLNDFKLYRRKFKIYFSSDLKNIIKPVGKKHSFAFLKHIEKRIYKNRLFIVCRNWNEIE
jgi:hypothetical protein